MKLFVVIFLTLAATCHAGNYMSSSEEDNRESGYYDTQKELNDLLKASTMDSSYSHWRSSASSMSGAGPYKMKVAQRIQNSNKLADIPDLQKKLYKLADEKLEKCVKPMGEELDRHCVGRATGQIMQIISAVENSSRHTSYTGERRRYEEY